MNSYSDLYYSYLQKCESDNRANLRDPHHDEMEWNHTLPQCLFLGHGPGQYLTLKQHAIASALQSLVFRVNCMCGWHKKYVPSPLLNLAWPIYLSAPSRFNSVTGREASLLSAERATDRTKTLLQRNPNHFSEMGKANFRRNPEVYSERGKNTLRKLLERNPNHQSDAGKVGGSLGSKEGKRVGGTKCKDQGLGMFSLTPEQRSILSRQNIEKVNSQRWVDPDHPELGEHSAGTLTQIQRRRGLPYGKENRIRVLKSLIKPIT